MTDSVSARPGQASRPNSPSRCSPIRNGPRALSMSAIQLKVNLSSSSIATGLGTHTLRTFIVSIKSLSFSPSMVVHGAALVLLSIEEVFNHFVEPGQMENNDRTLKELATPDVFPFSLDGATTDWLYLQPALFNTWGDMKRTFLEMFFSASRTASIRKEICGIRQHTGETLHEYWERFNKLCATCPHHQINEQLLI
ncbi:hypothetical protein CR513_41638, partial [Mucuna pruriens]